MNADYMCPRGAYAYTQFVAGAAAFYRNESAPIGNHSYFGWKMAERMAKLAALEELRKSKVH